MLGLLSLTILDWCIMTERLEVRVRVPPEVVWADIVDWGFQFFGLKNLNSY